jgi:hypothetical protein
MVLVCVSCSVVGVSRWSEEIAFPENFVVRGAKEYCYGGMWVSLGGIRALRPAIQFGRG